MKTFAFIIICSFCFIKTTHTQTFYGNSLGSYAGTQSIALNPANLAAFPFRFFIDYTSISVGFNNNFVKAGLNDFSNSSNIKTFSDNLKSNLKDSSFVSAFGAPNKKYDAQFNVLLNILNLSFNIGRHHGFALNTKIRNFVQFNDLEHNASFYEPQTAINNLLSRGINVNINSTDAGIALSTDASLNTNTNLKKVNFITNNFAQFGISYACNILEQGAHTLKAGLTFKYLVGLAGGTLQSDNAAFNIYVKDEKLNVKAAGSITAAYDEKISTIKTISIKQMTDFSKNTGYGIDIGGMYEWNPKYQDTTNLSYDRYSNPYKLKVGFSIVDLGSVSYASQTRTLDLSNLSLITTKDSFGAAASIKINNDLSLDSNIIIIAKKFGINTQSSVKQISIGLPTMMHLYGDYHIHSKFYVAANFAFNIAGIFGDYTAPLYSHFVISPRFQTQLLEVAIPFVFVPRYSQLKYGIGVRILGLYFGSDDLAGIINQSYGANVYVGLRLGINKSKAILSKYYKSKMSFNDGSNVIPTSYSTGAPKSENKNRVSDNDRKKIDEAQKNFNNNSSEKTAPLKILN